MSSTSYNPHASLREALKLRKVFIALFKGRYAQRWSSHIKAWWLVSHHLSDVEYVLTVIQVNHNKYPNLAIDVQLRVATLEDIRLPVLTLIIHELAHSAILETGNQSVWISLLP
jgi:hypothetical protein